LQRAQPTRSETNIQEQRSGMVAIAAADLPVVLRSQGDILADVQFRVQPHLQRIARQRCAGDREADIWSPGKGHVALGREVPPGVTPAQLRLPSSVAV